ncbi:glycerophosphodiester phosphodiesterase family protein [Pricia sp. S334]|uniref:Glycerophosphodiester phosphodiesterase family protein n=1 Tax=Pricia mediterranea TaxID=3076079 RepID=A0ABU3L641_9FLAO|nr:glycerophosphodiester phosphodiesterase family protein [Pricia sp. S334]MDT7829210.1 glycerophosphodiester phosphodiesterase family protein [Pricia sp. S334]
MHYFNILMSLLLFNACGAQKNTPQFADNVVVAHRGAWKAEGFPENSIAALKHAIALKCTGSEFDVHMTADDVLVINHDADHNGMLIAETSHEDLAAHKLSNGETLPTLRDYIIAGMEDNTSTRLVCEIKPAETVERGQRMAEKAVALVKELKAGDMTVYISFMYEILQKIEELDPEAHTQYLEGDKAPATLKADGIDGADYHFSVFKKHPEWIESAKKIGIALNAWTVNKPEDMDWLLEEDFDFITTNEPELLLEKSK